LAGTSYQWLDCDNANAPISGQTAQSFTPTASGNFAVQLTTNGCVSVSDCYPFAFLNTGYFNSNSNFVIYPNPTSGKITISNNQLGEIKSIAIYNFLGAFVTDKLDLSNQSNGIYFIKLTTENGVFIQKIIKK
jgi:Secretion system C-terminal sorting domain